MIHADLRRAMRFVALAKPAMFVSFVLVLALVLGGVTEPAAGSEGFVFEPVALMGQPAPGTEPGTVFGLTSTVYVTEVPSLDADGRVAFVAMLAGPAVTPANRSAVFTGVPGAISLVARAGAPAPGYADGVTFLTFPFEFALLPPAIGSGRYAFRATVTGPGVTPDNDDGLWTGGPGAAALLLREQGAAPDVAQAVFGDNFGFELSEDGDVLVNASLSGPGVDTTNDEGFWSDRSGALHVIFREGDPAPGTDAGVVVGGAGQFIGTAYTFQEVRWNDVSEQGVVSTVIGPGVDTYSNEALFVERTGSMQLLAREGGDAPGSGHNVEFGGNSVTADFDMLVTNALGQAAFVARVGGSIPTTYALFSDHTGELTEIARPFDPAPGTTRELGIIVDPALSPAGRLAFRAAFADAGSYPPLGIWWDQPGAPGTLSALVLPGDPLPDRPGTPFANALQIVGFSATGLLAFRAELGDPQTALVPALVVADAGGTLHVVAAHGDVFDVRGDGTDMAAITRIDVGGTNASGQMAIRLEFADGRFGFYRVSPAAPTDVGPGLAGLRGRVRTAPNPFATSTRFEFDLARTGRVGIDVFDVSGRLVTRLLDERRAAGKQTLVWDGRDRSGAVLPSGIYWARFQTATGATAVRLVRLQSR